MSRVPCTRSLGLSAKSLPPEHQEKDTLLILIVKGRGSFAATPVPGRTWPRYRNRRELEMSN
jgi:hypothetical protein